jgi:acid stress-induced BolA-like protein IbaG/YrbA
MTTDELQRRVEAELTGAQIEVTTDGYYFNIVAVSDAFAGKRPVQRQQMVYSGINDLIADGSLHAVNIQTYTSEEFSGKELENQGG